MSRLRSIATVLVTSAVVLVPSAVASAADPAVDTSFGSGGVATVALNGGYDALAGGDAFRLPDDSVVTAGIEFQYGLAVTRHLPGGTPDPSFDGDGIATMALTGVEGIDPSIVEVGGVVVDGAGSIYVALVTSGRSVVVKLLASGAPATAFGGGDGVTTIATDPGHNTVGGLRFSPDGSRLLVSFAVGNDLGVKAISPATGDADMSFGTFSSTEYTFPGENAVGGDLVVLPADGSIYVSTTLYSAGTTRAVAVHLTSAGAKDTAYGSGGVAAPWDGTSAATSKGTEVFAVGDGRLILAGSADAGASLAIARLTTAGGRDGTWDGDGLVTDYNADSASPFGWNGLNLQGDGSVVAAGGRYTAGGVSHLMIRRHTAGGARDATLDADITGYDPAVALTAQVTASRYVAMSFDHPATGGGTSGTRLALVGFKANLQSGGGGTPPATPTTPTTPTTPPSSPTAPATQPPAPAVPVPEGCARTVAVGPLQVEATCLKREGLVWTTSGTAIVGGLKFVPNNAGASLTIDPLNLRIAVKGSAKMIAQANLAGRQFGPVTLWDGAFDWTFQYKPDLTGLARLVMPQAGSGPAVSLPTLKQLPGLGGIGSLPQLPDLRLPDLRKLTAADVAKLAAKVPSLRTPKVEFPLSLLGLKSLPELVFRLPASAGNLLGFAVDGEAHLKMGERSGVRGVDVGLRLAFPQALGGLTGESRFFVGVDGQLRVDALGVNATEVGFPGGIRAAPVRLNYDGSKDLWSGGTELFLGYQKADNGIGGSFEIQNGQLRKIGVVASNVPIGGVLTLDRITGQFTTNPSRLTANTSFTAGPKVPVLGTRIITGNAALDFNGDFMKLTGDVAVANIPLAKALVEYYWNGYFHAKGSVEYFLDAKKEYGFRMNVDGEASGKGFNVEGGATFLAKNKSLSGKAILSSKGVAGCASIKGVLWTNIELGAGYKWGAKTLDWIGGSCDFGPYRAKLRSASAAQAGGPQSITLSAQRAASLKVVGGGGAPRFTLKGPDGTTLVTPEDGGTVIDDRFVAIQQADDSTTYVAIAAPKPGRWTITPSADSPPIVSVSGADALPEPAVTARVRGGRVSYTVKQIPGQTVAFVEEGRNVAAEIGRARGARGSFVLQPTAGPGGRRRIVAVVSQNDQVRVRIPVAGYVASTRPLAAPRVVVRRGARGATTATASWTPVGGAGGWIVRASFNGRSEQYTLPARTRRLVLRDVLRESGAVVTVQGLGGPTRVGRTGRGTISTPKVRKRTGKVPKRPAAKKPPARKRPASKSTRAVVRTGAAG